MDLDIGTRAALIADAIDGGRTRFRDPNAFVYTMVDYLTIGLGVPCTVGIRFGDRWKISTNPVGGPVTWHRVPATRLGAAIIEATPYGVTPASQVRLILESITRWLEEHRHLGSIDDIKRRFQLADPRAFLSEATRLDYTEIDNVPRYLHPFQRGLDHALRDFAHDGERVGMASPPQVAVTLVSGEGSRAALWRAASGSVHAPPVSMLPQEVFDAARSGFAQWSRTPKGRPSGGIAVPCAVSDFPSWAIVFCECEAPHWRSGLTFYRDLLPRILQDIRIRARTGYAQALIQETAEKLKIDRWLPEDLNERWRLVGRCFPFPVPRLTRPDEKLPDGASQADWDYADAIHLGDREWRIVPSQNPGFPRLLSPGETTGWGKFDDVRPLVANSLESMIGAADRATVNLAQTVAHEFKNMSKDAVELTGALAARVDAHSLDDEAVAQLVKLRRMIVFINTSSITLLHGLGKPPSKYVVIDEPEALERAVLAAVSVAAELFADPDTTEFSGVLPGEQALATLGAIVGEGEAGTGQYLLPEPVAFAIAPFAEPIRNIRLVTCKTSDEPIRVTVETRKTESGVTLRIVQNQLEDAKPRNPQFRSPSLERLCNRTRDSFGLSVAFPPIRCEKLDSGRYRVEAVTELSVSRLYRTRTKDG